MSLGSQHGQRTWASLWPLVATRDMDINTDPGFSRAIHQDTVLRSSPGLNVTMALGGGTGHSGQHYHNCRVALGYGPRSWPRPQASVRPSMATGTMGITTNLTVVGPWALQCFVLFYKSILSSVFNFKNSAKFSNKTLKSRLHCISFL